MPGFRAATPARSTVLVDDARSRVTRWDFEPGAETGFHRHGMAYVVVPMTDLDLLIEDASGERRVQVKAGAAYAREAGVEHNVANGAETPASFIEIEIKTEN